jgi:hypothetical protein
VVTLRLSPAAPPSLIAHSKIVKAEKSRLRQLAHAERLAIIQERKSVLKDRSHRVWAKNNMLKDERRSLIVKLLEDDSQYWINTANMDSMINTAVMARPLTPRAWPAPLRKGGMAQGISLDR